MNPAQSPSSAEIRLVPQSTTEHQAILDSRRAALATLLSDIQQLHARSVTLEIGCGHGHFLTAYAQQHSDELCIGVDIESARIERAEKKRDRAKLSHLHFIRADVRLFLEVLPATVRLGRIFVLFPDPWPKLRHHKHRMMQPDLLTHLAGRATTETRLYFRTDAVDYAEATRTLVNKHPAWELAEEPWPFEFQTVFQSRAQTFRSLIARPRASS